MDDNEVREQIAQMKAAVDQAVAASNEVARAMAGYYKELIKEGLSPEVAVHLVVAYQAQMFGQAWEDE